MTVEIRKVVSLEFVFPYLPASVCVIKNVREIKYVKAANAKEINESTLLTHLKSGSP